jgi:hypothetical protein
MVGLLLAAGAVIQLAGGSADAVVVSASGVPLDSLTCRVVNDADATAATRLRRNAASLEWTCIGGDRLECDAPAMEPIDVPSSACSARGVSLTFQKSGMFNVEIAEPAMVEWRAETAKGTRLIATRRVERAGRLPIALGGRIIRVHRPEASPVSAYVSPGDTVRLRARLSGGELAGRIQKNQINPVTIVLRGPSEREAAVDAGGRFSTAGVAPGSYEVIPVYRGGVEGPAAAAAIHAGQTSELYDLVKEPVGGVLLGVAPDVCNATDRLTVTRIQAQARAATFARAVQRPLADGCELHLEGLRPGRYEATIHNPEFNDLKAVEDFAIEPDRLAWATIGEPRVVVEGRVTLGDKPGAGLLVAFTRADSSARLWVTETDRNGDYRLSLDRAGSYAVEVRASRRMGAEARLARLDAGLNRFDLSLPSTRLTVRLQRADGQPIDEIVSVHIDGLAKARSGLVMPRDGSTLQFAGIPPGQYLVTADTNSGLVSLQPGAASISKNNPEAIVTLTLAMNVGELRLISHEGGAVQGARVQINSRILDEQEPGVFELRSVSPGNEVFISAPGHVPVCHVLTGLDFHRTVIAMTRGAHAAEITFTPPVNGPIGEITGLPGSTCAVPLGITSFGATEDGKSTTIRISGLPAGRFSYRPTLATPPQTLEVPGPPLKFTKPAP